MQKVIDPAVSHRHCIVESDRPFFACAALLWLGCVS